MYSKSQLRTPLCDLLGCDVPILLAGMGGVARWELAAGVANAGGFAALGMVRESPQLIASQVTALQSATDRPFAVNLIPAATDPSLLDAQIAQCFDLGVKAFSFFWNVLPDVVARVKREGALVLHQVGTAAEARRAEDAGADVIIAQGIEAGGHVHGRMGSFALAETILENTKLPVVVSGGISTGKGLASALALGAEGVQCGTAFVATHESFAHPYHKQCVVDADGEDTVLTDVFVLNWPKGAAVRVVGNSITRSLDGNLMGHDPARLPRDAIAWDDDQERYRFSTDSPLRTTRGDLEAMPNYAGQGAGLVRSVTTVGERIEQMVAEACACLQRPADDTREPPK